MGRMKKGRARYPVAVRVPAHLRLPAGPLHQWLTPFARARRYSAAGVACIMKIGPKRPDPSPRRLGKIAAVGGDGLPPFALLPCSDSATCVHPWRLRCTILDSFGIESLRSFRLPDASSPPSSGCRAWCAMTTHPAVRPGPDLPGAERGARGPRTQRACALRGAMTTSSATGGCLTSAGYTTATLVTIRLPWTGDVIV